VVYAWQHFCFLSPINAALGGVQQDGGVAGQSMNRNINTQLQFAEKYGTTLAAIKTTQPGPFGDRKGQDRPESKVPTQQRPESPLMMTTTFGWAPATRCWSSVHPE